MQVPVKDGRVTSEVRRNDAEGRTKLVIPAGFPAEQIPASFPAPGGPVQEVTPVPACYFGRGGDEGVCYAHWPRYHWANALASETRAFWVLDRAQAWESSAIQDARNSWSNTYGPQVGGNWPRAAYYAQHEYDNQCPRNALWTGFGNYSFVTVCTTHDPLGYCGNVNAGGCAYLVGDPEAHNGLGWQPNIYITGGQADPAIRHNVGLHELGHTLSLGHRVCCGSVMHGTVSTPRQGFDSWDITLLRWRYNHVGD